MSDIKHAQKKLLPNHLTPEQFGKKKDVGKDVVYKHIRDKKIVPDLIGEEEKMMINWTVYQAYEFPKSKRPKKEK